MKLVDILARELKVWPVDGCSIHQGVVGNLFTVQNGCLSLVVEKADDWLPAAVTRAQWQAAVDALKAVEGMPPIGSHVVVVDDGTLMYGQGESGEVLAHVDGTAVIRMSYGLGCFIPRCLNTKEKIAKAERTKACDQMYGVYLDLPESSRGNTSDLVEALYDAGYRKQADK